MRPLGRPSQWIQEWAEETIGMMGRIYRQTAGRSGAIKNLCSPGFGGIVRLFCVSLIMEMSFDLCRNWCLIEVYVLRRYDEELKALTENIWHKEYLSV
jgi:hypothetical protein